MIELPAERVITILHTLANGVRLLAISMPHVRSASVGVFLHVGSRDETPLTNGLSHVLEHMAFKGTTTRCVQADIVLNSTFPETELQRELDVIRQEAIEYDEDPQDSSSELLDRAIWGDDPMGMSVIGTVANLEGFTRHELVRDVQSHYVAQKTVVAVAGNFDVDAWVALAG